MYPAHDIPQKLGNILCNIRGGYNIKQPPNNAGRPVRQFRCLLAWLKCRTASPLAPLVRYCFLGGGGSSWGVHSTKGSDHMLTEWGNTPNRHISTEKYTSENNSSLIGGHNWFKKWLVDWSTPSYFLNQYCTNYSGHRQEIALNFQ